jgi:hypothetical protein
MNKWGAQAGFSVQVLASIAPNRSSRAKAAGFSLQSLARSFKIKHFMPLNR